MNRTKWFDLGMGALLLCLLAPFVPWEVVPWSDVWLLLLAVFLGFGGGLFLGCLLAMAARADGDRP